MSKKLNKNVPELRFPEFEGDWTVSKLEKIASSISAGATPLRSNNSYFENANIPWVKTTDLNNSEIITTEEYISETAIKETSTKKNPVGSILIAMYGGFNQIGRTGLLKIEAATNQAISVVVPKSTISSYFLLHFLNRNVNQWRTYAASSRKDPNITGKDIANFPIVFPKKEEQEKIASFLGAVDTRLTQLRHKRELLQIYKRGVIQKIFCKKTGGNKYKKQPKLRFRKFSEDWQPRLTSSFVEVHNRIAPEHIPLYSLTIESGITEKTERYERKFLVKNEDEAYKLVLPDDFAYNPMNLRFGAIARHKSQHPVKVSKYYDVFSIHKTVNVTFAEYLLTSEDSIQYYDSLASGSLIEKKRLHFSDFQKISFLLSPIEEQEKIADFLTVIDRKIEALSRQIERTERFKKGLLQKMFV